MLHAVSIPNHSTIADRALLVRLTIGTYNPYAYDEHATATVEAESGVQRAGRFNKRLLLDCPQLKRTNSAYTAVYQFHVLHTLPWLDNGMRMLPAKNYDEYRQGLNQLIQQAEVEADLLATNWRRHVDEDMLRLGTLAKASDYPSDIRARYYAKARFLPVPNDSDFRVAITDEDRKSLQDAIDEAQAQQTSYLLTEMLKPLRAAVDKLAVPIGADGSIFRDSLVSNILDAAQRARKLNVSEDPDVAAMSVEIERAVSGVAHDPGVLRQAQPVRDATLAKLDEMTKRLSAYAGV